MIPEWVRWLVLAGGIVILVIAWSASDSGFRLALRRRDKRVALHGYDDSRHGFSGGIARFKFMLLGLALILVAVFWGSVRPLLEWLASL